VAGEVNTTTVLANLLPDLHSDSMGNLTYWTQAQLIQICDEVAKRLAHAAMIFVERDTSISTAGGTATYSLPARHSATVHVSYGTTPLRPATVIELEARDPNFQTTPGQPDHWYEDDIGITAIGLSPVPTAGDVSVPLIAAMLPPDLDVGQGNVLLQAPAPVAGYLGFGVLAGAYGGEGESEIPDLAAHCRAKLGFYEKIFQHYYGPGL
jgi:hypothetical protein